MNLRATSVKFVFIAPLWAALVGCVAPAVETSLVEPAMEPAVVVSEGIVEPVMEPAVVATEPVAEASRAEARDRSYGEIAAMAGVLTAGDIDDTLNLAAFRRFASKSKLSTGLPVMDFASPVLARLTGPDGRAAPGVYVTLRVPDAAEPFWTGYSDVDGRISVFPALSGAGHPNVVELRALPTPTQEMMVKNIRTGRPTAITLDSNPGWRPDFLDLVFVVDTTGSMTDELAWLTRDLAKIVQSARTAAPGVDIRQGLILYRDEGDDYVVRNLGFTHKAGTMKNWLRAQQADGGGDYPEAAAQALHAAVDLPWRRGKGKRIIVHVADAPPHDAMAKSYLNAVRGAAAEGIEIYGLGASGVGEQAEFLMRQASAATGGRYIFLTDDSGVGYGHAEPTISCYQVTRLSELMVRILKSELSGIRVEAPKQAILRQVGSYDAGVCRE